MAKSRIQHIIDSMTKSTEYKAEAVHELLQLADILSNTLDHDRGFIERLAKSIADEPAVSAQQLQELDEGMREVLKYAPKQIREAVNDNAPDANS